MGEVFCWGIKTKAMTKSADFWGEEGVEKGEGKKDGGESIDHLEEFKGERETGEELDIEGERNTDFPSYPPFPYLIFRGDFKLPSLFDTPLLYYGPIAKR